MELINSILRQPEINVHLLDTYAFASASKVGEPFVYETYFPLPNKPYITIHASSGMESKNYDHWKEVVRLIEKDILKDYMLLQIGLNEGISVPNSIDLRGKTTINQIAHVLRHSSLHISNDSFSAHIAGWMKRPLVTLYSINHPATCRPYWHDGDKTFLIESERKGLKPSYSPKEESKMINCIKPETIAEKIYLALGIDYKKQIETLYIGEQYSGLRLDSVPNDIFVPQNYSSALNIRSDFYFNEEIICRQLTACPCVLIIDQPMSVKKLNDLRRNLSLVVVKINNSKEMKGFVNELKEASLPIALVSEALNEELNKQKLEFIDFGIGKEILYSKDSIEFKAEIDDNTLMRSSYFIFSNGKIYPSRAHLASDKPVETINSESQIIDNEEFWKDSMNYFIYQRK